VVELSSVKSVCFRDVLLGIQPNTDLEQRLLEEVTSQRATTPSCYATQYPKAPLQPGALNTFIAKAVSAHGNGRKVVETPGNGQFPALKRLRPKIPMPTRA